MRRVPELPGIVVAIDGPSGSGKSSVSREVARRAGLRYLDTGAMYRAATWVATRHGRDLDDVAGLLDTVEAAGMTVSTDPDDTTVWAEGTDVTADIRGREVTAAVSSVSAVPALRARLVARQQELIGAGGIVVEGRDIAEVVAPGAAVKVYLTADEETRAGRRVRQDGPASRGHEVTRTDLVRRDRLDSSRATSPLAVAPGAVVIDSTGVGLLEVVDRVLALFPAWSRP